jgi:hypothetical protein
LKNETHRGNTVGFFMHGQSYSDQEAAFFGAESGKNGNILARRHGLETWAHDHATFTRGSP